MQTHILHHFTVLFHFMLLIFASRHGEEVKMCGHGHDFGKSFHERSPCPPRFVTLRDYIHSLVWSKIWSAKLGNASCVLETNGFSLAVLQPTCYRDEPWRLTLAKGMLVEFCHLNVLNSSLLHHQHTLELKHSLGFERSKENQRNANGQPPHFWGHYPASETPATAFF